MSQDEHRPSTLRVQDGASAAINCTYIDSTSNNFLWYKQGLGEHPKLNVLRRLACEFGELKNQVSLTSMNMLPDTCSVLVLLLMLRRSNGDSVTQTEGLVTVTEGSPVMLNCTYQTTYAVSYISWYVQYPKKVPLLLLRSSTDYKRTEHQGFHATLQKSNSSFHLHKSSVQLSDSALYYCALSD
ncbi:hypothetical protein U0070_016265, partial [Myodes glareolus]